VENIRLAVLGYPVSHSLSPLIHNYWIEHYGLDGSYEAIEIHPDEIESRLGSLIIDGYSGFNVTLPHKQTIMTLCSSVDNAAVKTGAVNTVKINDDKQKGTFILT